MLWLSELFFFFSSRRRHTRCALVTGVQTCALPIFLEASGIAIEAALIVIFDTNSWRVLPQVVAKDEQLERAIIDAGNHYWNNHVLRGELPPYIGRPLLQPGLNVPPALRQAARHLMVEIGRASYRERVCQ